MGSKARQPTDHLWLAFDPRQGGEDHVKNVRASLSAIACESGVLWVAGDEDTFLDRLEIGAGHRSDHHHAYDLSGAFRLPDGSDGEVDTEGLCVDGTRLWVMGSHSRTRKKAEGDSATEAFGRMAGLKKPQPNRYLLGFLELPAAGDLRGCKAAALPMSETGGNELTEAPARDGHIGPFLPLPAKENGLDIEGFAVAGKSVFLGLRGPVLSGLALVLELKVAVDGDKLRLERFGDGRPYLKHALDLGGLGVRDLVPQGDRMLVLTGPTMKLDGPASILAWDVRARSAEGGLVDADAVRPLLEVPVGVGCDHPEGVALLEEKKVVVYDSPAEGRLADPWKVRADVFDLEG